jgi:hypothetical protein
MQFALFARKMKTVMRLSQLAQNRVSAEYQKGIVRHPKHKEEQRNVSGRGVGSSTCCLMPNFMKHSDVPFMLMAAEYLEALTTQLMLPNAPSIRVTPMRIRAEECHTG